MRKSNTLYDGGLILILVGALVLGGLGYLGTKSLPITGNTLYAAESTYALTLQGAVTYRRLCDTHVLPPGCGAIVRRIQAANNTAKSAYVVVKSYELNPPQNAITAFAAATEVFRATVPGAAP